MIKLGVITEFERDVLINLEDYVVFIHLNLLRQQKKKRQFKVISKEIIASLTREISKEDMIVNNSWELAPIITNNNLDRY